eukprot:TRINITY_DN164_c0_g1_i4.p1 TRINITY_DN164_c0_g1~~TRINITY_DN164_c0_g1_i4.p1  ORF type:complete len:534 (-),score=167.25 TRINITY_DN164_c0_g1_i4:1509-2936(-)
MESMSIGQAAAKTEKIFASRKITGSSAIQAMTAFRATSTNATTPIPGVRSMKAEQPKGLKQAILKSERDEKMNKGTKRRNTLRLLSSQGPSNVTRSGGARIGSRILPIPKPKVLESKTSNNDNADDADAEDEEGEPKGHSPVPPILRRPTPMLPPRIKRILLGGGSSSDSKVKNASKSKKKQSARSRLAEKKLHADALLLAGASGAIAKKHAEETASKGLKDGDNDCNDDSNEENEENVHDFRNSPLRTSSGRLVSPLPAALLPRSRRKQLPKVKQSSPARKRKRGDEPVGGLTAEAILKLAPTSGHGKKIIFTDGDGTSCCNCKKSRCLKLYCECFAKGQYCNGCNCSSCLNRRSHEPSCLNAVRVTVEKNPFAFVPKITGPLGHRRGCRCRRSHCLKKYCECFQAGVPCGVHCKCTNCMNHEDQPLRGKPTAAVKLATEQAARELRERREQIERDEVKQQQNNNNNNNNIINV